ncbi:MAG: pyridoxamine 5'-phosphate oxidase family protein [Bellilinea sp.]
MAGCPCRERLTAGITARPWVGALLAQPVFARLATANPISLQPHVVPVWFEWDGEAIWISSFDTTRKMRDLARNPRVSIVIDAMDDAEHNRGVVFEGKAEVISDPAVVVARATSIYIRYQGEAGARKPEPASWSVDPEKSGDSAGNGTHQRLGR